MNKRGHALFYGALFFAVTISFLYMIEEWFPTVATFITHQSLFSILFRTVIMFTFSFVMLRLLGKRYLSQLTFIDILIIICFGSAVGDVMIYQESVAQLMNSIIVVGSISLMVLFINHIIAKYPSLGRMIEGRATILVKHGKIIPENLLEENMNEDELMEEIREMGIRSLSNIDKVVLEPNGKLSYTKRRKHHKVIRQEYD